MKALQNVLFIWRIFEWQQGMLLSSWHSINGKLGTKRYRARIGQSYLGIKGTLNNINSNNNNNISVSIARNEILSNSRLKGGEGMRVEGGGGGAARGELLIERALKINREKSNNKPGKKNKNKSY